MRSQSVKTVVTIAIFAVTITFAVPVADAQPARSGQTIETRTEPRGVERIARAVRRVVNRLTGGITTSNWPTVPVPSPTPGN